MERFLAESLLGSHGACSCWVEAGFTRDRSPVRRRTNNQPHEDNLLMCSQSSQTVGDSPTFRQFSGFLTTLQRCDLTGTEEENPQRDTAS